jgi:hypothetical protein
MNGEQAVQGSIRAGVPQDEPTTILDLARVLRSLIDNEAQIDRFELQADGRQKAKTDLWRTTNFRAIEGLEQVIAAVPASHLADAAVQILIAAGHAKNLVEEMVDAESKEVMSRLALLLRSALPVVAREAGIDLAHYGAERYGQGTSDWPFRPVEPLEPSKLSERPRAVEVSG